MAARTFRLKIVRAGEEFEAEGDKPFVVEMLKRFAPIADPSFDKAIEGSGTKSRGQQQSVGQAKLKLLSIREFIQQLGLKKHTDIALAFGFYLEKHAGVADFTPADINTCYYEAKLEASNTSQMIIQNIKSGRIMPGRERHNRRDATSNLAIATVLLQHWRIDFDMWRA